MNMYMYTHKYIHMYTHMNMYIFVDMNLYIHIYIYMIHNHQYFREYGIVKI